MVVLLNFEPFPVGVDLELGLAGSWVELADLDSVDDIPPHGTNTATAPTALRSDDGRYSGFELPSSSGFIHLTRSFAPPIGLEPITLRVDLGVVGSGWSATNTQVRAGSSDRLTLVIVGRRG
jgi:hypothetical protein